MNKQNQWLFEVPLAFETDESNFELEGREWEAGIKLNTVRRRTQSVQQMKLPASRTSHSKRQAQSRAEVARSTSRSINPPLQAPRKASQPPLPPARPLTYTDVRSDRIDVFAQTALLRMSKNPAMSADAAGMVAAVKSGKLGGIYKEDEKVPALRAKKMNSSWWKLIPPSEDAILFLDPEKPKSGTPIIVFRDKVRSALVQLGLALQKAWKTYQRFQKGEITQCKPELVHTISDSVIDLVVSNLIPIGQFCWLLSSLNKPDSLIANKFIPAHASRWCTPGNGSGTCRPLTAPRTVERIIIHTVATQSRPNLSGVESVIRDWQQKAPPKGETSAHYLIDRDGTITQMVRESDVAFHAVKANPTSIGIEHADLCNHPKPYTTELYERSAQLVRDIARRHKIPISKSTIVGHKDVKDGGNHEDPGRFWDWDYYFLLLLNDGLLPAHSIRRVLTASEQVIPQGWMLKTIQRGQVQHCASDAQPYGSCLVKGLKNSPLTVKSSTQGCFWQATPNSEGVPAVFRFLIFQSGTYKLSLWWPRINNANRRVRVDIETCTGVDWTCTHDQSVTVDQSQGAGQWNDLGHSFTIKIQSTVAEIRVSVHQNSAATGSILADAARLLRTGA